MRMPSDATKRTPSDATKRTPSDATKRTPSDATNRTPLDATKRTPSDATNRTPTDATNRTPSDATNRTPSIATKRMPSDATKRMPSDAPKRMPSDANNRTPSDATMRMPSATTKRMPSDPTMRSTSDATMRSTSDATMRSPSDATMSTPSDVTMRSPSDMNMISLLNTKIKSRKNYFRVLFICSLPREIINNSTPNSYLVRNGMARRFGPMEYTPCKTAQNNVLGPKPALFKTNNKTTLGGICGSSELCLPDSKVSQPHYTTTITTAPSLFRSRPGCNTSDTCFPQCSTSVDEARHLEDSSLLLQTAACHHHVDRRVNGGMGSSVELHSHCKRPLVTEGEISAH